MEESKYKRHNDPDYDPHDYRVVNKPTNYKETLINLLKGCVGTGILAMPSAFSKIGTISGIITTAIIGFLCCYCMRLLVKATYITCKQTKIPLLTYGEAMTAMLAVGPPKLQFLSKFGGILVDTFLIVYQVGICSVYVVFVAVNVKDIMDDTVKLHLFIYFAIFFIPFCLITLLKSLKIMVPVSLFSTILTFLSFGICLYYVFQDIPKFSSRPLFKSPTAVAYPLFIGTTMYAIQAVGVVIAIENNMKNPKSFTAYFGVFNISQIAIIVLFISIGLFGYWKYGDEAKPSLTLNLPQDEIASKAARGFYAFAIYTSYGLQAYPAIHVLWESYLLKRIDESKQVKYEFILRITIVVFTYIFALTLPMLGLIISLVGCFCLSALGLIFPPFMDCLARYPDQLGKFQIVVIKNVLLIILGFGCFLIGTYCTMYEIVEKFKKHDLT